MNKIETFSYNNIKSEVFRLKGKELRTNFFLTEQMFDVLNQKNKIKAFITEDGCYLLIDDNGFERFYFIVKNGLELEKHINLFVNNESSIVTCEIVGNKSYIENIEKAFLANNFNQYTSLVRMSKSRLRKLSSNRESIHLFQPSHKDEILGLFNEYFDKFAERIPSPEELELLINNNSGYYFSDNDEIQGFIIFENHGFTSHLRYWFVHPNYRDKKIGSKLIDLFFTEHEEVKRELFWVIESNENAIKRYQHFGFKEEDMYNVIMINKNLKYEG